MRTDALKRYVSLRDAIIAERKLLVGRLREIDGVLGAISPRGGSRTPGGRVRNDMSLKEAVLKALDGKSLTKREILEAVQRMGYQFSTSDPLNSLGVVLYGRSPKFKNVDGKFRV